MFFFRGVSELLLIQAEGLGRDPCLVILTSAPGLLAESDMTARKENEDERR
jgi:hypothetical protein